MQFRFKLKSGFASMAMLLVMALPHGDAIAQSASEKTRENQEPLTITLSLKRVAIDEQGKETLVDVPKAKPGNLLEYKAVYANAGQKVLRNISATLPVPEGMEYVAQTARPLPVLAATKNGNFSAEPLMRPVKGKDGKDRVEPVPYAEYKAVRWQVKVLEPGKSFVVSARMRVSQNAPAPMPPVKPAGGP